MHLQHNKKLQVRVIRMMTSLCSQEEKQRLIIGDGQVMHSCIHAFFTKIISNKVL